MRGGVGCCCRRTADAFAAAESLIAALNLNLNSQPNNQTTKQPNNQTNYQPIKTESQPSTGSFLEEGMEWGPRSSALPTTTNSTNGAPSAHALPAHRYRNRAASSTLLLRGQGAGDVDVAEFGDARWHAGWAADPLAVGASSAKFCGYQMAATLLATDQVRLGEGGGAVEMWCWRRREVDLAWRMGNVELPKRMRPAMQPAGNPLNTFHATLHASLHATNRHA